LEGDAVKKKGLAFSVEGLVFEEKNINELFHALI
jgi:hypothetical protein